MVSRSDIMQTIFNKLSERNKDIMILIAKSIKIAQETDEQVHHSLKCESKC